MPNFLNVGQEFILNLDLVTHVQISEPSVMKASVKIHFTDGKTVELEGTMNEFLRARA
jgi:hypothetical protein